MNFFKRALISISRRKGKSIILFAVIFILGNVMAGAIAIDQGTKSVETNIKKKLGSVAMVTIDNDKVNEALNNNEKLPDDISLPQKQLDEIGKLDEVAYYDYSYSTYLSSKNFKTAQLESDDGDSIMGGSNYFNFKGVIYNEVLDIKNKIIQLEDGKVFDKEQIEKGSNVVLMSEEMAKANNAKVGDKITMDLTSGDGVSYTNGEGETKQLETYSKDYQVEIIGIFKVLQSEKKENKKDSNQGMNMDSNYFDRINTIYAPNNYVKKVNKEFRTLEYEKNPEMYDGMSKEEVESIFDADNAGTAVYTLKSPEVTEDFKINAEKIIRDSGDKYNKILISSDQYNEVAGPVKGMSKISKLVLIISIVASILIISLVIILFLRDRKHELGIYLSLGEERIKVIGQIVIEVVIVALIAITISVFTGNLVAKSFSNSLIQTQKTEESLDNGYNMSQDSWIYSQMTNNNISEDDVVEAYNISLSAEYVFLFYIVGIGVVLVSTVVPLIYILRLNPKKIMM